MKRRIMHVRQVGTGETALGRRAPDGCVLVQFDRFTHPHSHGWHLYPRHHFERRRVEGKFQRSFAPPPNILQVKTEPYLWAKGEERGVGFRPVSYMGPRDVDGVPNHAAAAAVPGL